MPGRLRHRASGSRLVGRSFLFTGCLAALALFPLPAPASRAAPGTFDAGFFASRQVDAHGDTRLKVAGPFFEMAQSTQGWRMVAVRPFYSQVDSTDPAGRRLARDYLWPLGTRRDLGNESQSRYLLLFSFRHDEPQPKQRYRFWLLPIYYQGRDARGHRYAAVFPLGGTIREFLGRDEISFVLFPLRSTSRLNDLRTSNWLWPLISETKGDGTYRMRFFPFYGRSVLEGHYEKRFVLWPIWNSVRYDYAKSRGGGYILFPLWGHVKLTDQETWWAIPPLFRYTRGEQQNVLYCPWPFVQRVKGKDVEKFYLWPLWTQKRIGDYNSRAVLWPLISDKTWVSGGEKGHRFMLLPVFTWETRRLIEESDPAQPPRMRAHRFWPVYSYRREGTDSRFRTLELWPFAPAASVERNWAPFWTIFSRVRSEDGRDTELLWGLYRSEQRGEDGRAYSLFPLFDWRREEGGGAGSWSFLKGLLGRERAGSHRSWRLLYFIHLGDAEEPPP